MKHDPRTESGQVIVILTIGIVILLGFAALAIDGGMFYADRRYDQNTADNAALAGASAAAKVMYKKDVNVGNFDCSNTAVLSAINAAYSAAETSAAEFITAGDHDISDGQGVSVECSEKGGAAGNFLLVRVKITAQTKTAFAHLVYSGPLQNTVEAVSRLEPGVKTPAGPAASGAGLVGLSEDCNGGTTMLFNGTVNVTIATGGVHSNSCMNKTGASGYIVTQTGSEYRTDFSGHEAPFCIGTNPADCNHANDPKLTETIVKLQVPAPNCAALDEKTFNKKDTTIVPGRYTSFIQPNKDLTFAPGLYCFEAGAKFTGKNIVSVSGAAEDGITIYVSGGNFEIGGSMTMNLRAPRQGATGSGYAVPGMLLYTPEDYTGTVSMLGNATSTLRGTIFVPGGTLEAGGSSYTSNWAAQMLGKWVWIHGNTTLKLLYENNDLYWDAGKTTLPLLDFYQ